MCVPTDQLLFICYIILASSTPSTDSSIFVIVSPRRRLATAVAAAAAAAAAAVRDLLHSLTSSLPSRSSPLQHSLSLPTTPPSAFATATIPHKPAIMDTRDAYGAARTSSDDHHNNSSNSDTLDEKEHTLEPIYTNERVGSHENYYEKGGLRTEGDGEDHVGVHQKVRSIPTPTRPFRADRNPMQMNPKLFGALTALAFCWVGSQIPLYVIPLVIVRRLSKLIPFSYLFGGIIPDIYSDIGGVDRWIWIPVAYLIALAAICPFTGALSDLLGRRYVAMLGSVLLVLGTIVCSTAKNINIFIAGMVFNGLGAGINELIALAGTGELVPTAKRGAYVGAIVFTIVPFCPSVLYAQLILQASSWRYVGVLVGVWNFLALVFTVFFYWPPERLNSEGYSRRKVLQRIDWMGGFLSIVGVLLFLMGLQWSAQQVGQSDHRTCQIRLQLTHCVVSMELCSRSRPLHPRHHLLHPFRHLGSQVCKVCHGSRSVVPE